MNIRVGILATAAALFLASFSNATVVYADTVKLSGHISTTAKYDIKYVLKVPPGLRTLAVAVPLPASQSVFGFTQNVLGVEVTADRKPLSSTDVTDQFGNQYCLEKYFHPESGTIEIDLSTDGVSVQSDLVQPFPVSLISKIAPPAAVQPYLKPSARAQSSDPAIVARAKTFLTGNDDEATVVTRIQRWLQQSVIYVGKPPPGDDDAVSILHDHTSLGDGWANLFVALARADGIPARFVNGYYLQGQLAFPSDTDGYTIMTLHSRSEPHSWVEVWFPGAGWVPCDPQISAGFIDSHHLDLWTGTDSGSANRFATWTSIGHPSQSVGISETETTDQLVNSINLTCISSTPEASTMTLLSRCSVGDQLPAPTPHP